ncbi:DNA-processing protein DprA [Metabacillus iocasae]|uniref:DNA processing protein n=1 Tax=Priestia iocasae TaxID=2291674 RepID=A0ABS2QRL4_9BACI|nr:DNA-processing protein DprA [Metabacillus iocasae]MBM7701853.1 DNA processing protein [Metabacillus iocasae]
MDLEIKTKLIHLTHCPYMTWKAIYTLFQYDPSLENLYQYSSKDFQNLFSFSQERANRLKKDLQTIPIQAILDNYEAEQIHCITIFDNCYPELLRNIYDPPWVLYAKGDQSLLKYKKVISVVGTRHPTSYGHDALKAVIDPLLKKDWLIVSGLAEGIDTIAHELAIGAKSRTIAVLGSGIYNIYPSKNKSLAKLIADQHLLLSEYPPTFKPQKWYFPMRNRIISGLTLGTVVVQAKERSGSFITADQALQQGREVFAIPGSIFDETSRGTNRLIQLGAKLILTAEDIREEL